MDHDRDIGTCARPRLGGRVPDSCRQDVALIPAAGLGTAYVSLFRGTPCLIQLFVLYFGGPQVGINLEPFAAGVIGLGLNIGAYMAESIRGAVLSVDRGQTEAARSIGFSRFQTMRRWYCRRRQG